MVSIGSCIEAIVVSELNKSDPQSDESLPVFRILDMCKDSDISRNELRENRSLYVRRGGNSKNRAIGLSVGLRNSNRDEFRIAEQRNLSNKNTGCFSTSISHNVQALPKLAIIQRNQRVPWISSRNSSADVSSEKAISTGELYRPTFEVKDNHQRSRTRYAASTEADLPNPECIASEIYDQCRPMYRNPQSSSEPKLDAMTTSHDSNTVLRDTERCYAPVHQPFTTDLKFTEKVDTGLRSDLSNNSCKLRRISSFENSSAFNSSGSMLYTKRLVTNNGNFRGEATNVGPYESGLNSLMENVKDQPLLGLKAKLFSSTTITSTNVHSSSDVPLDLSYKYNDYSEENDMPTYGDYSTNSHKYLPTNESNQFPVHMQNVHLKRIQCYEGRANSSMASQLTNKTPTVASVVEPRCYGNYSYKEQNSDCQRQNNYLFIISSETRPSNDLNHGTIADTGSHNQQKATTDIQGFDDIPQFEIQETLRNSESSTLEFWKNKKTHLSHQQAQKIPQMPTLSLITSENCINSCQLANESIRRNSTTSNFVENEESISISNKIVDKRNEWPNTSPADHNTQKPTHIFTTCCVDSSNSEAINRSDAQYEHLTKGSNLSSQVLTCLTTLPPNKVAKQSRPMTNSRKNTRTPFRQRKTVNSLLGNYSANDILRLKCKVCSATCGSVQSFRSHFVKVHGMEPEPNDLTIQTISETKSMLAKYSKPETKKDPLQELPRSNLPPVFKPHYLCERTFEQNEHTMKQTLRTDTADESSATEDHTKTNEIQNISSDGEKKKADAGKSYTLRDFLESVLIYEIKRVSSSPSSTTSPSGGALSQIIPSETSSESVHCMQTSDDIYSDEIIDSAKMQKQEQSSANDVEEGNFHSISHRIPLERTKFKSGATRKKRKYQHSTSGGEHHGNDEVAKIQKATKCPPLELLEASC